MLFKSDLLVPCCKRPTSHSCSGKSSEYKQCQINEQRTLVELRPFFNGLPQIAQWKRVGQFKCDSHFCASCQGTPQLAPCLVLIIILQGWALLSIFRMIIWSSGMFRWYSDSNPGLNRSNSHSFHLRLLLLKLIMNCEMVRVPFSFSETMRPLKLGQNNGRRRSCKMLNRGNKGEALCKSGNCPGLAQSGDLWGPL